MAFILTCGLYNNTYCFQVCIVQIFHEKDICVKFEHFEPRVIKGSLKTYKYDI